MLWARLLVLSGLALTAWAEERFQLRGELIPPVDSAVVAISGVNHPYQEQKQVAGAHFRFRRLPAGTYTILVAHPEWGETRRTITVNKAAADHRGRVEAIVPIRRSSRERSRNLADRSTVSVRELQIPDEALDLRKQSKGALEKQNAGAAAGYLERAVEVAPDFADAWNDLGVLANQHRDFERAEQYFREALDVKPDAFAPLVNLAGVLLAQRKLPEATRLNARAVAERPDDALANAQLGLCYFYLREEGLALKYLIEAKRLDPGHFTHPQAFLAEIHTRNGRLEAAIRELEDLAARYPGTETGMRAQSAAEKLRNRTAEATSPTDPRQPDHDEPLRPR